MRSIRLFYLGKDRKQNLLEINSGKPEDTGRGFGRLTPFGFFFNKMAAGDTGGFFCREICRKM